MVELGFGIVVCYSLALKALVCVCVCVWLDGPLLGIGPSSLQIVLELLGLKGDTPEVGGGKVPAPFGRGTQMLEQGDSFLVLGCERAREAALQG